GPPPPPPPAAAAPLFLLPKIEPPLPPVALLMPDRFALGRGLPVSSNVRDDVAAPAAPAVPVFPALLTLPPDPPMAVCPRLSVPPPLEPVTASVSVLEAPL